MKVIYAGTPDFAVPALRALCHSEHVVAAVYTQPDRPAGRGRKLQASAVKQLALEHDIEVRQPENFKSIEAIKELTDLNADLMVVAAYGLILPVDVLIAPRLGCVNLHASLLPRWRGAAPIQRAILAGDQETGITLMQMAKGLDTGDILDQQTRVIESSETTAKLHDLLKEDAAKLLIKSLPSFFEGNLLPRQQDETLTLYAEKLSKQEAEVNWGHNRHQILNAIRAYNPWPVSYGYLDGQAVRLWQADDTNQPVSSETGKVICHTRDAIFVTCKDGVIAITEIQWPGKKRMSAADLLNARDLTGTNFGEKQV
ncbi:MAG: methionyl-tRNA formyltransferase [Gammaproteobacteria bacterium]|jgi:methionyl-tRNA formyltransferase